MAAEARRAASRFGGPGITDSQSAEPVIVVTDADYRCVWRPCEPLEEPQAPAGQDAAGQDVAPECAAGGGDAGA